MKTDSNITSEVKTGFERWMVDVYGGNLEMINKDLKIVIFNKFMI